MSNVKGVPRGRPKSALRGQRLPFKREFSAGCVVFKQSNVKGVPRGRPKSALRGQRSKVLFLIGKHSGYHQWVLPKGLIEKGEHGWQTCLRETAEEMGIKAKLITKKPIHKTQYYFIADFKKQEEENHQNNPQRRVAKYQEAGGGKVRVFKVVSFYLAEYVSGSPQNHDWEMEDAGWYSFEETLQKLAFPGEKQVLQKAKEVLKL